MQITFKQLKETGISDGRYNRIRNDVEGESFELVKLLETRPEWEAWLIVCKVDGIDRLKACKELVEAGASDLDRALRFASGEGELEVVKYLIDAGAEELLGALWWASMYKHLDVVKYLEEEIKKGEGDE